MPSLVVHDAPLQLISVTLGQHHRVRPHGTATTLLLFVIGTEHEKGRRVAQRRRRACEHYDAILIHDAAGMGAIHHPCPLVCLKLGYMLHCRSRFLVLSRQMARSMAMVLSFALARSKRVVLSPHLAHSSSLVPSPNLARSRRLVLSCLMARSRNLVLSPRLARSYNMELSDTMARSARVVPSLDVARSDTMVLSTLMARSLFLVPSSLPATLLEAGAL